LPNPKNDYNSWREYLFDLQLKLCSDLEIEIERIRNMWAEEDPKSKLFVIQMDVFPGPKISSTDIVNHLQEVVESGKLHLTDKYQNQLTVDCLLPIYPFYDWTDYGPCPTRPCMNGGICNCNFTGLYYCKCPPGYSGEYCDIAAPSSQEKKQNNLLWLLVIPAAIGLLLLALCCLFCCYRQCCCWGAGAAAPQKIEIVEEDIYQDVGDCDTHSVRSCRSVRSVAPPVYTVSPAPMMTNDPGSTYYHALGRPFAVAFTDNTFSAVGYATSDLGMYSGTGKKIMPASLVGDDEVHVIMNGNGGGSCCGGSVYSEGGSMYHSALGNNRHAVAYSDRTFNAYASMPRDRTRHYN
jgi:hypothetical protein